MTQYIAGHRVGDDVTHYYTALVDYRSSTTNWVSGAGSPTVTPENARAELAKHIVFYQAMDDTQIVKATIERTCMECNGTGKVRSKRSKYKTVRCHTCRGKESRIVVETWIDLPRSAWVYAKAAAD